MPRHRLGGGAARRPVDRAAAIRWWVAQYGDRHGIEVWAWFHPGAGRWEVDFERVPGGPRVKDVRAAIAAHRYLREYPIAVATAAGAEIRWGPGDARARPGGDPGRVRGGDRRPDAATDATLLDTLVNPGCPISPGARALHGLSDADVAGAPRWAQVLPGLLEGMRRAHRAGVQRVH